MSQSPNILYLFSFKSINNIIPLKPIQSTMESSESSCYSTDEEYFLDIVRAGEIEELKQFIEQIQQEPTNVNQSKTNANQNKTNANQSKQFDWFCVTNSMDNWIHMASANNLHHLFEYLYPIYCQKVGPQKTLEMANSKNSTGNTPLHYTVITDSIQMTKKLLEIKVDTNIKNQFKRTAFDEAAEFDKIAIAQILAPITKNNLEELKKEEDLLEACREQDSDEEQQKGQKLQQVCEVQRQIKELQLEDKKQ